jgi:hypothetical protein
MKHRNVPMSRRLMKHRNVQRPGRIPRVPRSGRMPNVPTSCATSKRPEVQVAACRGTSGRADVCGGARPASSGLGSAAREVRVQRLVDHLGHLAAGVVAVVAQALGRARRKVDGGPAPGLAAAAAEDNRRVGRPWHVRRAAAVVGRTVCCRERQMRRRDAWRRIHDARGCGRGRHGRRRLAVVAGRDVRTRRRLDVGRDSR